MKISVIRPQKIIVNRGRSISHHALPGVSIITCTNRNNFMERVFDNYMRQNYQPRELIIVLNSNSMRLNQWMARAGKFSNIRVFQLDEQKTQGECLNFAIDQCHYDYIAKFDDDDYYASAYLDKSMAAFNFTGADIVGKCSYFVYFEKSQLLAIATPNNENRFMEKVAGATLVIKKELLKQIRFPHIDVGEDTYLQSEAIRNGYKIYSGDRYDYVCIRRQDNESHTWKVDDEELLKYCEIIAHTGDFITPATT